jgi:hypothetical protein
MCIDDNRLLIDDLYTLLPGCELLFGLHDVAHAASGHHTLGMVYTRSNVGREASNETQSFGAPLGPHSVGRRYASVYLYYLFYLFIYLLLHLPS